MCLSLEESRNMAATRIAVIGAGVIGKTHLTALSADSSCQIVGVADPSDGARAYASECGIPWYVDHSDMLDGVHPEGAIIATPNNMHVPVALECISRGVAVLVEKPIADTVEAAKHLSN